LQYDRLIGFNLSVPNDISTATLDGFLTRNNQTPLTFRYSGDGTKFFDQGTEGTMIQYTVQNAPFDISSTEDSKTISLTSQDTQPTGIKLSPDGTKLFYLGDTGNAVYEYLLSTAYDIRTAVYSGNNMIVNLQDNQPSGFHMDQTGTRIYVVGLENNTVYQYILTTPYLISSGSYDSKLFVPTEETKPRGITLNPTGTKMYIIGSINNTVYQYSLSVSFDVSTASYDTVSFDVSTEDTLCLDLFMNAIGTKMFVLGGSNREVNQYTLSTPFNVSSATYNPTSLGQVGSPAMAIDFTDSGESLYVINEFNELIRSYTVTTGFDLDTATRDVIRFDFGPSIDFVFNNDGTKAYIAKSDDKIYQYSLSVPYRIEDVSYDSVVLDVSIDVENLTAISFNSTGSQLYVTNNNAGVNNVYRYLLSSAFDLSTAIFDVLIINLDPQDTDVSSVILSPTNKLYALGRQNDEIYQYTITG